MINRPKPKRGRALIVDALVILGFMLGAALVMYFALGVLAGGR